MPVISRTDLVLILGISRFRFVLAGFTLYLLGYLWAVLAGYWIDPARFIAGYTFTGCAHLSVHFSNEYFDRAGDRTGMQTPVSGGTGILVSHPALAGTVLYIAILLMALSVGISAVVAVFFSYPLWLPIFVVAGNLTAWWYSAPPFRFSSMGLGELATMLAIALFLPGSGYIVAAHRLDTGFLSLCVPLLFLGLYFILSAELPDMELDRHSGKWNFVARHGRHAARRLIALSSVGATVAFALAGAWYPAVRGMALPIALLSCLLPAMGLLGFFTGSKDRQAVTSEATRNVLSLVLFVMLADGILLAGSFFY
jgi:1,4-dihydroxy-2-naphthoate polyprenyltransferase